jgi:rfaE bifunctional protein nucleotidyltransferase chain/domain
VNEVTPARRSDCSKQPHGEVTNVPIRDPNKKVLSLKQLVGTVRKLQQAGSKVVFTNGCFDLIHVGHIRYLREARLLGDALVVAVNSDASVRAIKGPSRPLQPEAERAEILASLECVDYVTIFSDETPHAVIAALLPDVLVKGSDWPIEKIVGREIVEAHGGRVMNIPIVEGRSTTEILNKILAEKRVDAD